MKFHATLFALAGLALATTGLAAHLPTARVAAP